MLLRLLLAAALFAVMPLAPAAAAGCAISPAFGYDARAPLQFRAGPITSNDASQERDVQFISGERAAGGMQVRGVLMRPRAATGPLRGAAILWVHWLGDPATTNHTEFIADARALAALGATSLLVDAMWAQPEWFDKDRSPASDLCDLQQQVIALRRALDVLAAQGGDPKRIAYVGHDFGAMYGALLLAVDSRPSRAVLMTPTLSFWEWFLLGRPPADTAAYIASMSPYDLPPWLGRTHASATLLQFGKHDAFVSQATESVISNAVPAAGRTVKSYEADHALHLAAATDDRRAWLVRELSK